MILLTVVWGLSTLLSVQSNTVSSPQIRILDVATKASETRLIPQRIDYRNTFHPYFQQPNNQNIRPPKSYVIYDEYPVKIFKEWKAEPPVPPQTIMDLGRQQNGEFPPGYYFHNGQQVLPPPKPTLAYRSVYSNVIKVFDNSLDGLDRDRFNGDRYRDNLWKHPVDYDPLYPQDIPRRQQLHLPENFPKVFSPNENFHFPAFDPPRMFYPLDGYYDTYTVNYNKENTRLRDEVELIPDVKKKNQKKPFLCGFIRVNQREFPDSGGPCARSDDDLPVVHPEYPDYSNLPNDKIPVEHRRQHFQIKRIKRSELNESYESRQKRQAGFGYGYSSWGSPLSYESGYEGYFSDNYPSRRNSGYYKNKNQGYRNGYNSGSRYDDYDYEYNNDESNSRGLSGYLTNGGRRYRNRNNHNDGDDDDDEDENDKNRDDDSEEEMERMNSNRRDTNNDRRSNNDDSRDRRRNNNNSNNNNNNYNDDDEYRENNRRNNNRNNNSRRNNNRRYNSNNDRYDNNGRNRYSNNNSYNSNAYGNSNYGSNGYGSSYGSYGSNYGGYGSGGYGGYGNSGGYGYGGYGNGFGGF